MDNKENKNKKERQFKPNSTYMSISIYTIITFIICLVIFKFINNWREAANYFTSAMDTLSPFLIAILIVYFITPLVNTIDRILFHTALPRRFTKLHKYISLALAYLIFIGAIVLILSFLVPHLADSIMQLVRQISTLPATLSGFLNSLKETYPDLDLDYIQSLIDNALPTAINYVQSLMTDIIPTLYTTGRTLISWIINIILAFVISCYLMSSKGSLLHGFKKFLYTFFDETTSYKIIVVIKECNHLVSKFIIGKFIDSLIMGILCFIVMRILGLSFSFLICVVVGVTNMIPYFGPFFGAIPSALILLIVSPMQAVSILIMILVLQQFDGNILGPKILGDSVGVRPLWIIFAITVGGAIGGVIGMFLGVPVIAVITYLANMVSDYVLYQRNIKPDLSNVKIPDINYDNILIPKDAVFTDHNKQNETADPDGSPAANPQSSDKNDEQQ